MPDIPTVTKEELRQVLICGTKLHQWGQKGKTGLDAFLADRQRIQLDPLNPAGRQHDVLLFSRVPNYKLGDFERWAYPNKKVFESYHYRVQCAIDIRYFPLFYSRMTEDDLSKYGKERFAQIRQHHPDALDKARAIIKDNNRVNGKLLDFGKMNEEVMAWKTNQLGTFTLDMMWFLGEAVITERDHKFQKWYGPTASYVPEKYLTKLEIDNNEYLFRSFELLLQDKSVIDLGQKRKSKKVSYAKSRSYKPSWFERDDSGPQLIECEETKRMYAVRHDWREALDQSYDMELRVVPPLDPLIHDRDLTQSLFDFEYLWEVYVPKKKRIWGYYQYPILQGDQMIGRLEVQHDRKQNLLVGFNLIKEDNADWNEGTYSALYTLLQKWKEMVGADEVILRLGDKEVR